MAIVYPLVWPRYVEGVLAGQLMVPTQLDLAVVSSSKSSGKSLSGIEQIVGSPAARWQGKFSMPTMSPRNTLVWRGFIAAMQGRVGTVVMPAFEQGREPWPLDFAGRQITPRHARSPRLRGTPYAVDPEKDVAIIVTAAAAAPLNATQLTLSVQTAGPILAGQRFSTGGHLYEVMQAVTNDVDTIAVDIRPWLRAPVAADQACDFQNASCVMRFQTDEEGAVRFTAHRSANPTFSTIEAF